MPEKVDYSVLRDKFIARLKSRENDFAPLLQLLLNPPDDNPGSYLLRYVTVSADDPRLVSYPKSPKVDPWDYKQRYRTRFSKWLTKVVDHFPEEELLDVSYHNYVWQSVLLEERMDQAELVLLQGEEIADCYTSGAGGIESCMTKAPKDYFDIYAYNPDKISLALLMNDGEILARALVYHDMHFAGRQGSYTALSRAYSLSGAEAVALRNIALSKGWLVPKQNSPHETVWVDAEGNEYSTPYVVLDLPQSYYGMCWPYIDCLNFVHIFGERCAVLSTDVITPAAILDFDIPDLMFWGRATCTDGTVQFEDQ